MSSQTQELASVASTIEVLYLKFLKSFYGTTALRKPSRRVGRNRRHRLDRRQKNTRTPKVNLLAVELEAALTSTEEVADSIRGEEIRSLLAEFRDDFAEAARCREAEIRKILELHSLTVNTPHWEIVSRQYDFSDVSDRLDLLAMLYDRQGDTTRAIATLKESKAYCASHGVEFDGQDLLDELEQHG